MAIKVEIYRAANQEFSFRVKGGNARITLTPGETYKTRGAVRRAVRTLARWSEAASLLDQTPLETACYKALEDEQTDFWTDFWNNRKRGAWQ